MAKIKVHEKALAHLSRGLYRSPASALRELVSNAWDANATEVRINTNYPNFFQISVEDNGIGFEKQEFKELMEGGIGNSEKRNTPKATIDHRPIIGRLGIGMLGIAQICGAFSVISKPRNGIGFKARVHLYDLLKEKLDIDDKSIVRGKVVKEIDVGEYDFEAYNADGHRYGTMIIADDVHPTFIRSFQESLKHKNFKETSLDWKNNIRVISRVRSLQELGDYWRLIWEMAASCPVPYISDKALPDGLINEEQSKLLSYKFNVILDNINIYKPVWLQKNLGGYTWHKINNQIMKIYEKDLEFNGYILVQEGAQLQPDELRGIMIRIKNVGIGYYDQTMLDYRINEGPRSRWVTGEIFVNKGLEDALNIDRDSFNRFHPEYRAIQKYVHKILQENIFPAVYKKIEIRSHDRGIDKDNKRNQDLKETISRVANKPVTVKSESKPRDSRLPEASLISVTENSIKISLPHMDDIKTKKSNRKLAASILTIFDLSMQEKTLEARREKFKNMLLSFLSRW